jgi:MoaA/NifB/PqqE/SkfB family radical SAM enzyme
MICKVPSVSLNISSQGYINLCCEAPFYHIKHIDEIDDLESFFNSSVMDYYNKNKKDSCVKCLEKIDAGTETFKTRIEKYFVFPRENLDKKARSVGMNVPIRHLEFTLSNICNQTCAMCSSFYSNKWQELDKKFINAGRKIHPLTKLSDTAISKIEKILYGLDYIELKGGEPFADIKNFRILKKLVEVNPKCTVHIITNMQRITPEAMSIIKQLPNTKLFASIDGTHKIYDWIRDGNFDKTVKTMEHYYNETGNTIQIGTTISLYNFFNLLDIQDYFSDKKYIHNIVFDNWVQNLANGAPDLLGKEVYNEQISKYQKTLKNFTPKKYTIPYDKNYNHKINFDILNKHRGFNLLDHVPQLKEWYN